MKDPFNTFIDDSVYTTKLDYYNLMFKTKRIFFQYLEQGKSLEDFKKRTEKIWEGIDHSYMAQRIKELQDMIEARDLLDREILNPDAKYKEVYELAKERDYISKEKGYKKNVDRYYKEKIKTVEKEYIDKKAYLSELVEVYDKYQATIPYYNKNGTIHSWHNIADYNSMLFNTNLNRAGWNRTLYDANLLEENLLYLPAHTFACPLCMPYQGKVYSKNGTSGRTPDGVEYQPKEVAIEGGVGHPNCKHQWLIYWDKDQIQKNDYNNEEWEDKYKKKQKARAIKLQVDKLENDKAIYKKMGNQEMVDKTDAKLKKLNEKYKEIKSSYK